MKKVLLILGALLMLLALVACDKGEVENQLRDKIEEEGTVSQITIYYSGESMLEGSITDGYIEGYDVLYQTESEKDIERIWAMLEGWKIEENKVSDEEQLDLLCDVHVCFYGNKVMMSYSEEPSDDNYYGYLDGEAYHLPKELGEYIENLLNES